MVGRDIHVARVELYLGILHALPPQVIEPRLVNPVVPLTAWREGLFIGGSRQQSQGDMLVNKAIQQT
jgi:hypothetical protein